MTSKLKIKEIQQVLSNIDVTLLTLNLPPKYLQVIIHCEDRDTISFFLHSYLQR